MFTRRIQFRPQEGRVVLQPLPSVRVVDQVRESLRSAIMTGELPPGTRLSVPELARRLNVSRSPVREAVLHLVSQGLAVEHSHFAHFVGVRHHGHPTVVEIEDHRVVIGEQHHCADPFAADHQLDDITCF